MTNCIYDIRAENGNEKPHGSYEVSCNPILHGSWLRHHNAFWVATWLLHGVLGSCKVFCQSEPLYAFFHNDKGFSYASQCIIRSKGFPLETKSFFCLFVFCLNCHSEAQSVCRWMNAVSVHFRNPSRGNQSIAQHSSGHLYGAEIGFSLVGPGDPCWATSTNTESVSMKPSLVLIA